MNDHLPPRAELTLRSVLERLESADERLEQSRGDSVAHQLILEAMRLVRGLVNEP